jgi:flagellar protein FliT
MDASSQAIANYEALSILSGQMRDAAIDGEWDQLIGIEQGCGELVAAMKLIDVEANLNKDERQYKIQLIDKILADDAEVRTHVQAWMGQLELSMQSNRQEQRLLQAYGA